MIVSPTLVARLRRITRGLIQLRQALLHVDMAPVTLARLLGVSRQCMHTYLQGRSLPPLPVLVRLEEGRGLPEGLRVPVRAWEKTARHRTLPCLVPRATRRRWSRSEDVTLRQLWATSMPLEKILGRLGRSLESVRRHARTLALPARPRK